jgi:hypothetical protein
MKDNDFTEIEQFFEHYILNQKLAFKHFFDFWNHKGNFSDTAVA